MKYTSTPLFQFDPDGTVALMNAEPFPVILNEGELDDKSI